MQIVKVNNADITVKEYKGQRVITFKDIDTVHERPEGTAKRNFKENRKRFIESEDFFVAKKTEFSLDEFRTLEIPNRGLTLITESGYLMLVKSFTDDLAWEVQRQLVKNYFNPQPANTTITYQYPMPAATFEGVANLGRLIERVMRNEGSCPHEIAIVLKPIMQRVGYTGVFYQDSCL